MLAIIILYFLRLFWPYIIIVFIGNFITRQILECNDMQSTVEEEVDPSEKATEETKQEVQKTKKRRKNSKSNKTSDVVTSQSDVSIDPVENLYTKEALNKDVTRIFNIKPNMSKFFVVNEDVFLNLDPAIVEQEQYCGYHLYKVMKSPEAITEMDGQDEHLTEKDLTEDLLVTKESTKHGVIINSNVYLTNEQWHTIRQLDKDIFSCTVCQFQCDAATVSAHIRSLLHARNLDAHRPLKRFDLSITRKINENLHCAVCNSIYPVKNYSDHENLKSHEETLLTAINKVTDILYDDGYSQKTTQSFNNNNIQAPNNAPHNWLNFSDVSTIDTYGPRNEAYSPRNEAYSPRNEVYSPRNETYSPRHEAYSPRNEVYSPRNEVYSPRNVAYNPRNETFTPSYENTPRSDSYSENRVQTNAVETKNFHFSDMFGDIKIYEEDEMEEYTPPIEGISYASMASKPRVDVPKFLKIDLGTKEVRVKYESWHMITQIDINQVYCMVCKSYVLVRHKNHHCVTDEHKALLAQCNVVGAFEDYLIRDVNDKLYHCGHCNNLQVKNDIQPHIEKYHPMKNGNIKDINPLLIFSETKPKAQPKYTKLTVDQPMKSLDIFGDFQFSPFGSVMVVSNLGYHTLIFENDKYICALCNVMVQGDLMKHVYEPAHMQYIMMTPFIRPFQSNLTRAIRGGLHCLLCNVLVPVAIIYTHNMSAEHTANLARALGMRRSERPVQEVKYQCEGPNEFKTELERFLSTLPPDSREALSKLTIKNHKGEIVQISDTDSSSSPSLLSVSNSPTPSEVSKYPEGKLISPVSSVNNNTVINNRSYPPLPSPLYPGQMVSVSMLESRLPGKSTGSPVAAFRPPLQLQITGPMDLKLNQGLGRIPVSPIRRKEDIEGANDLLSLYKQSPVRTKAPEKKAMETVTEENLVNIDKGTKIEKVEGGEEKNEDKNEEKKKTGKGEGPMDLKLNQGLGRIPVSPIRRKEDQEGANDLLSLYKQSPVRTKAPEKKAMETVTEENLVNIDNGTKIEKVEGGEEKNEDKNEEKKKTGKGEDDIDPPSSISDDEEYPSRLDEPVLLKIKTSYFRVTNIAYQTLVHLSNGSRYCFVCSQNLDYSSLKKHVDRREHINNMAKNKFLCNFNGQLLRQMYLMYHCCLCNVTMSRRDIRLHLAWPIHLERHAIASKKLNKKILKTALREGVKELPVETQKEYVFVNIPEPSVNIVTYVQSVKEDFVDRVEERKLFKKSQMIILKGTMMKISFESWHGIVTTKSGTKCILCQTELSQDELPQHVDSKYHNVALGMPFQKQYYPALARQINASTINCVICNLELPADESHVAEHISGRKHDKKYSAIVERTSQADCYSDCYKYPITL